MNSGIYKWTNLVTKQVLIGQTQNFKERHRIYLVKLKNNNFSNTHFQASWNKHGQENFKFEILERVLNFNFLTAYEQFYLDYYRKLPGGVYNQIGPVDSPNRGRKYSQEHKDKLSKLHLGHKASEETKAKMSLAAKGKIKSLECRQKLAIAHLGRKHSPESRAKMSETTRNMSDEVKDKIRQAIKKLWQDPIYREARRLKKLE